MTNNYLTTSNSKCYNQYTCPRTPDYLIQLSHASTQTTSGSLNIQSGLQISCSNTSTQTTSGSLNVQTGLQIPCSNTSTQTTDGSLVIHGGVSLAQNIHIANFENYELTSTKSIYSSSSSSDVTTGTLTVPTGLQLNFTPKQTTGTLNVQTGISVCQDKNESPEKAKIHSDMASIKYQINYLHQQSLILETRLSELEKEYIKIT